MKSARALKADGSELNEVSYTYDPFGNLQAETLDSLPEGTTLCTGSITESQYTKTTSYIWNVAGQNRNRLKTIRYPSTHRFQLRYDPLNPGTPPGEGSDDLINRPNGVEQVDSSGSVIRQIAAFQHLGSGRTAEQVFGDNALAIDYMAGGWDRFGRVTNKAFKDSLGQTVHEYGYGYDKSGNRTYARITQANHDNDRSYLYTYDQLNRLIDAQRGELDCSSGPCQINNLLAGITWDLDLLGNWTDTGRVETGTTPSNDVHTVNAVNEILSRSFDADGAGGADPVVTGFYYDPAGNLVFDGQFHYTFDAWNRLAAVREPGTLSVGGDGLLSGSPGASVAAYDYDALGRRIAKHGAPGACSVDDEFYYYDGNRLLEKHVRHEGAGFPGQPPSLNLTFDTQLVYGLDYIDEAVARYETIGSPPDFVLQDGNYNVVAITNSTGVLEEQYTYDPYGRIIAAENAAGADILTPNGLAGLATILGHQGLVIDPETGLYYNRARHYDPELGRFVQRDPNETAQVLLSVLVSNAMRASVSAGVTADGLCEDGISAYVYVRNNPIIGYDPSGLYWNSDDPFDAIDEIIAQYYGEKAAAAEEIWNKAVLIGGMSKDVMLGLVSFFPGGDAILLGAKILSGEVVTMQDWIFAAASIGGGAVVAKAAGKIWKMYSASKAAVALSKLGRSVTRFVAGAKVIHHGKVIMVGTADLSPTLDRIARKIRHAHVNDGETFQNIEGLLPSKPFKYYTEYVHPTPGIAGAGPQRIVVGLGGEYYYSPDHYATFVPLN